MRLRAGVTERVEPQGDVEDFDWEDGLQLLGSCRIQGGLVF